MPRRNQRLDHLLSPVQQRRLRQVREKFLTALDESPRDQRRLNQLRAQMPPGGLSWPWWGFVLGEPSTGRTDFTDENRTAATDAGTRARSVCPVGEVA